MRIAICDDSRIDAKRIKWALMDLSSELDIDYFESGRAFLDAVRGGLKPDAVFLDVYMPGENGVDIAKQLHEICPDTGIIFCTSSKEHAVDAFKVAAVDYIVKPCEEIDVIRAFARVRLVSEEKKNTPVIIKTGGEVMLFKPDDVVSISSDKHYTIITLSDGSTERIHMNYSDVAGRFTDGFLQIKRGVTVRMDRIARINGEEIVMSDDTSYTISRQAKEAVINTYMEYMEARSMKGAGKIQ